MKKIISKTILILLVVILTIVCYKKYIKKEEYISLLGKSFYIVYSGSMKPEIDVGELLVVSRKKEYKENDIITFKRDGKTITHRIIKIGEEIITKGDNNNVEDSPIKNENIIGKVIYHSKTLGIIYMVFLKPFILIYMLILIFISVYEKYKKEEEVNEKG